jgi:hypothetical protein
MAAVEKNVIDSQLKKSTSIDREPNNSPASVVSANQSRDGTPVDCRNSPSNVTRESGRASVHKSNTSTPPISKQNSQSPKSKESTPSQKRTESVDEVTDKLGSVCY